MNIFRFPNPLRRNCSKNVLLQTIQLHFAQILKCALTIAQLSFDQTTFFCKVFCFNICILFVEFYTRGAVTQFLFHRHNSAVPTQYYLLGMLKIYTRYTTRYKMMYDAFRMQPYPKNSKILLRIHTRTQNRSYHK